MRLLLLLAGFLSGYSVEGYKILCIFVIPSRSHFHLANGVVDALLQAGHEVTWGSAYPELAKPKKNLRIIDLSPVQEIGTVMQKAVLTNEASSLSFITEVAKNITIASLQPELRDVLVKEQFDAVVTEWFFCEMDAAYAAIQQAPWIVLSSVNFHILLEEMVDEVRSVSTIPHFYNAVPLPMTMWQRALNYGVYGFMTIAKWYQYYTLLPVYEDLFGPIAKARGIPLPRLADANYNVSIVLVNSHPSFVPVKSVPPNVVDIGGFHIDEEVPPLPKDLQDLLDSSKCVVYFSFGSIVKSSDISEETRAAILAVLGKLPCLVLWKFEEELLGAPKNVHVRKWLPQASVLAHPNVKLFITHGGLLSIFEAISAGKPLLVVPFFGDQPGNAQLVAMSGFGRTIEFKRIAEDMETELNIVLKNDSYYHKAQYLSKLFNNRLVKPKKLISHYIELAIETKGAYHLRSPSLIYSWYQRWMLDVLLIVFIVLAVVYIVIKLIYRTIKNKLFGIKKQKVKTQ